MNRRPFHSFQHVVTCLLLAAMTLVLISCSNPSPTPTPTPVRTSKPALTSTPLASPTSTGCQLAPVPTPIPTTTPIPSSSTEMITGFGTISKCIIGPPHDHCCSIGLEIPGNRVLDIYEVDQGVYNEINNNKLIPQSQVCFKAVPEMDGSLDFTSIAPLTPTCQMGGTFIFKGEFGTLIPMGSGNMLVMLAFTVNPRNRFQYTLRGDLLATANSIASKASSSTQLITAHVLFSSASPNGEITTLCLQSSGC